MTIARLERAAGSGWGPCVPMSGEGLLKVAASAGARRRYGPLGLARLRFIRRAAAGFSLADIGGLVRPDLIKHGGAEMTGKRRALEES